MTVRGRLGRWREGFQGGIELTARGSDQHTLSHLQEARGLEP